MEENLLKYFTNNLEKQSEPVMPTNIENVVTSNFLPEMSTYWSSMVSNDGNYFIRYGGQPFHPTTEQYDDGGIEIFTVNSIKNEQLIYAFRDLKIRGHGFAIRDLHQGEDGRFYGIGNYVDENLQSEYYLIIFNNFLQDGFCKINKFYTPSSMGMSATESLLLVIKKNGSGEYFIKGSSSSNKLYKFKIDILEGNSLTTYNYTDPLVYSSATYSHKLDMIGNTLFYTRNFMVSDSNNKITNIVEQQLRIDIDREYAPETIFILEIRRDYPLYTNIFVGQGINNYKIYEGYMLKTGNQYKFAFNVVDWSYDDITFVTDAVYSGNEDLRVTFSDNYVTVVDFTNKILKIFYYEVNNPESLINFVTIPNFNGTFSDAQVMKQFNMETIVGLNTQKSLAYSMNVLSKGYSSTPYINKNFLEPQYLNLYANANDMTSLIYSRDRINKFLAGNQLTTTFNVPNYLINNEDIKKEVVKGQTNLDIVNLNKTISKNRFESLYITYMNDIQIFDNTNGNNVLNQTGSDRLANSVWNLLDDTKTACLKARITYEDGSQSILNLNTTNISGNVCTITYNVNGNIIKIEYMSNDLKTIYATYRCELTGTNTIVQTITIS